MILHPLSSPPGASPGLRAAPILRPLRALLTCSLGPRLWGIAAVAAGPSSSSLSSPPACPRRSWIAPGWGGTSFPLAPFRGVPSLLLREPVVRRDPLVPPHQGTDDSSSLTTGAGTRSRGTLLCVYFQRLLDFEVPPSLPVASTSRKEIFPSITSSTVKVIKERAYNLGGV